MIENSTHRSRIFAHYKTNWGAFGEQVEFLRGPIHDLPPDFGVLQFPPREHRRMWAYATCCMSQPNDESPLELHAFSRDRSRELVELLVATAHYHRTGKSLGLGHTVNFGKSWIGCSGCDHGLVSRPYLDGPKLEYLEIEGKRVASFYWLIPVTESEVEFKRLNGIEALETRLEEASFDYLDPNRPAVL